MFVYPIVVYKVAIHSNVNDDVTFFLQLFDVVDGYTINDSWWGVVTLIDEGEEPATAVQFQSMERGCCRCDGCTSISALCSKGSPTQRGRRALCRHRGTCQQFK